MSPETIIKLKLSKKKKQKIIIIIKIQTNKHTSISTLLEILVLCAWFLISLLNVALGYFLLIVVYLKNGNEKIINEKYTN